MSSEYPDHIQPEDIYISVKEELASAITHGAGAIASVVGLVFLLMAAFSAQDVWVISSALIYGLSLVALYLASTIYHSVHCPYKRDRLKHFDHCAIYLLIAGSYTPFFAGRYARNHWLACVYFDLEYCCNRHHSEGFLSTSI